MNMKPMITALLLLIAPLAVHAGSSDSLTLGSAKKGENLHNRFCTGCHTSAVYTRPDRSVNSYGGLVGRVGGCSSQLKLEFSRDQISDIVAYLNSNFYKFDPEK